MVRCWNWYLTKVPNLAGKALEEQDYGGHHPRRHDRRSRTHRSCSPASRSRSRTPTGRSSLDRRRTSMLASTTERHDLAHQHARSARALQAADPRARLSPQSPSGDLLCPSATRSFLEVRRAPLALGTLSPSRPRYPYAETLVPVPHVQSPRSTPRPRPPRAVTAGRRPRRLRSRRALRPGRTERRLRSLCRATWSSDRVASRRFFDAGASRRDRRALGAPRVDQRPGLLTHLGVEADRRLVGGSPAASRARASSATPAHAARKLVDAGVASFAEVGHRERALDHLAPIASTDPVEVHEDEQVLLHGERDVEVVELRRDATLAARYSTRRAGGSRRSSSPSWRSPSRWRPHRRRLARAVRPEQATHVPSGTSGSRPPTAVISP